MTAAAIILGVASLGMGAIGIWQGVASQQKADEQFRKSLQASEEQYQRSMRDAQKMNADATAELRAENAIVTHTARDRVAYYGSRRKGGKSF